MNVTTHFTLEEFACHDGVLYPSIWVVSRLTPLCLMLETIRGAFDRPLVVISGYRSPAHNVAVGGAMASQHMEGKAADITVVNVNPIEVHAKVLELYQAGKLPALGGVGRYAGWTHVDIRDRVDDHLSRWTG